VVTRIIFHCDYRAECSSASPLRAPLSLTRIFF
jgi:hypothetical protein